MTSNFTRLNANRHRYLKLMEHRGYQHARSCAQSDLMLAEFGRAAAHYPIVFAGNGSGAVRPVVLLSREGLSNAFVGSSGHWLNTYVPMVIRLHPFAMARASNSDALVVCIDMNSELLSPDTGVPLFDMNGDPAPALDHAMQQLNTVEAMLRATEEFCRALQKLKLLAPLASISHRNLSRLDLDNLYYVDERALDRLGDAALCVLRNQGWLTPLYAHRVSLMQIDRLPPAGSDNGRRLQDANEKPWEGMHA